MARLPRLYVPGCSHHIIQRGNNRQRCFLRPQGYAFYLQQLELSAAQFRVAIHAFILMTNHAHLLVSPSDSTGCGKMMQSLGKKYVRYFNINYRTLFDNQIGNHAIANIRECTNKGWVLGEDEFKEKIKEVANRPINSSGWGGDRRSRSLTP